MKKNFLSQWIIITIFLACLSLSSPLYAENLLEIYNSAVRSDPVSIVAQLHVLIAEERQQLSSSALYPHASIDGSASSNSLHSNNLDHEYYQDYSLRLSIEQVLFDIVAWRDNEKFKLLIDKSSSDYKQAQSNLVVNVVERYFNVLEKQDAMALFIQNTQTTKKNVEMLEALYEKQLVPVTGVYEARARHDASISIEIEATAALSVAFERLYEIIGERVASIAPLKEDLKFLEPNDDIDKWLELAIQNNPTLAANKSNMQAAAKNVSVRKAGFAPRFSMNLSQASSNNDLSQTTRPHTETSSFTFNLSQPLYKGGGISARKRESVYQLGVAKQIEIEGLRHVEQLLREHFLNLKSDVLKVKANARLIESEKKRSESMRAGFKFGTVTVTDVLDADAAYLRAQLEHQKAKYNYIKNQIRLKSVAGVITEQDVIELNKWVN